MKEAFYQMYKASRDLVEELRHRNLSPIHRDFVEQTEINCRRYDNANPDFYERWKKETFTPDETLLFRFHRGSLEDSMETCVEIKDLEHLINLIEKSWDIKMSEISIKPYGKDERIGWDTQIVSIKVCAGKNCVTYPVGFLNKPLSIPTGEVHEVS